MIMKIAQRFVVKLAGWCLALFFSAVSVLAQTTIFSDGFEGAFPGSWVVGNNNANTVAKWGNNNAKAYADSWSAFCADNGSNSRTTYDNNLNTYMQRQGVSLSGYNKATLTFKYWMNTQSTSDRFEVNARNQSGTWANLMTISGNQSGSGWQTRTINMDSYGGQTGLIISFDFVSDSSVVPSGVVGVWVDDVSLTASAIGNIQATLRNQNGVNATASKTKFILYPGTVALSGSNPATYSGLAAGNYWVEGYQNGPFSEYEYWGSVNVNVVAGQTASAVVTRNTPYTEDFWFEYNGSRITSSSYVPPGATVTPKATVRNRDTVSRSVYVTMGWRFGTSGSAAGTGQSSTVAVGANSTVTITLPNVTFTSNTEGDIYAYVKTYAYFSNWALTDSWDWTKMGAAAWARIQATLKNWDANNATSSKTKFILYPGTVATNGYNPATYSGLATGSYWVEGYQNGPFSEYEYWGSVNVTASAGQTVSAVVIRNTPYTEDFWLEYNGSRISSASYIPPGATVTPKATVRNRDSSSRSVYVTMGWRFGTSGGAVGTGQSSTVTVGANSALTITLPNVTFTANTEGDVYAWVKTYGYFSNWALTDSWDWTKLGATAWASIQATLKNWDGNNATASRTKFILYPGTVPRVGGNPTNYTGLTAGSYWVEGYQNGPFNEYEFWGSVNVNAVAGQTVAATVTRNTPYTEDFWLEFNGSRVTSTSFIPPGATVTPKATVRNRDSSSRSVYVTMSWRFGTSGAAVGTNQSSTVTVGANSTVTITLPNFVIASTARDDIYAHVKTYGLFSGWSLTDSWDWTKQALITPAQIISFSPPSTGIRARGTTLQTTVQVKNNTSSARSFWVGLSFAHETATNAMWPVGFYDIQPIQTPTIQPGQTNTVTFTFAPHKNLRPGQYFARASTWPGFDSTQYIMIEPRLDDTLNNSLHPEWTTSRPERIGLASFSLGSYEAPRDTLLGQIEYAIKQDYFKVATLGDLYRRQPNAQKPLLVVSAGVDGTVFGIPVGASGSVLIDMADLLDLSPEGNEWVTVWVDAEGHVGYNLNLLTPGSPVDISVIPNDFVFAERALADRRLFTVEVVGASIPGFTFTTLSCDVTGCDAFRLQWNGSTSVSLNLIGASKPLVRAEVSKNILRNIFTNNPTGITGVVALRDYLINAFHGFSGSIRTATLDDGDWPLVSLQRETPLTLPLAWTESEKAAHYFYIDVPAKTTDLTIQTTGGTGDTDLYVRYASRPTSTNSGGYDFKSANAGNTESISIPTPQVGRWFIMLPTTTSYSNIELLARVTTDTNAPTVSITLPASGTTYTNAQSIPISANATDNVAVVRVEFFDGAVLKSTDTTAPYSNYWTFTGADNGAHAWTARAYDAAGNVSTSSVVTLTVSIDATSPTVTITSPANGATLTTSTTTVSGTASDPGSPASGLNVVQVRVNGGSWSNATGTTSWSRSVALSPCGNTIEARSLDKAANYSTNASIFVTYSAPNTVPSTPSNVSPVAGATGLSLTPTLTASAFSDTDCTGDTHAASQWQVLNSAGTVVVADSGTNTLSKVSWTVPAAKLNYGSNYVWRVRYQDSRNGWSSYSAQTAFTTGGPQLNGTRVGANIVLSWPTNASAFKLFYATNFPAATWISNTAPTPIVSGRYTITNSMTNSFKLYRLKK